MPVTLTERFIRLHEEIKARAIYAIYKRQKARFANLLEEQESKGLQIANPLLSRFTTKADQLSFIDPFVDDVAPEVPGYLVEVLPKIMNAGAKKPIAKYKELLPEGYALVFDIETAPAAKYLTDLQDLMISQREGSISKTTRDELRRIVGDGVSAGSSYGEIAKQIREVDPWVFSKARSKTIAVNEVGRAYGWAAHEPGRELSKDGYVLEKKWASSDDDKVRPEHMQNEEAGWIPFDEEFPGTGDQYAPSFDINCRCTSGDKVVAIKDGKTFHPIAPGTPALDIKAKHFEIFGVRV